MNRPGSIAALIAVAGLTGAAWAADQSPAPPAIKKRDDARRERLEQRARELEARAADPPMQVEISDAPQETGLVPFFKNLRWKAQLKREALEARADAEAARPKPDHKKIATLRAEAARKKADEARLTAEIAKERKKEEASRAEREKAFSGLQGVGVANPDGGAPARLR